MRCTDEECGCASVCLRASHRGTGHAWLPHAMAGPHQHSTPLPPTLQGIVAVLTSSPTDVLSHIAIRARSQVSRGPGPVQ